MAGFHGKNAKIYVAVSKTLIASGTMFAISGTNNTQYQISQLDASGNNARDWQYIANDPNFQIQYQRVGGSSSTWKSLDNNNNQINYAAGAVVLPDADPGGAFVTVKNVYAYNFSEVGLLVGNNRRIELNTKADPTDATTMGEFWGVELPGIPRWSGSIQGLYLDKSKFQRALQTASGVDLARIARVYPVSSASTYYQGTVIFNSWSMSMPFDNAIEETLEFSGQGPLDAVVNGAPIFQSFV